MQNEFSFKDKYPYKAGHRGHRNSITSAKDTDKRLSRLHKQILIELYKHPKGLIGSELANILNINLLTIRPRTTELKLQGIIVDTEKNKNNEGGKPESIYKLRSETLLEEFNIDVSEHKRNTK